MEGSCTHRVPRLEVLACGGGSVGDSLPCSGVVRGLCPQPPLELHKEEGAQ